MGRIPRSLIAAAAALFVVGCGEPAIAAEGDIVLTEANRLQRAIRFAEEGEVRLYGPAAVTKQLREGRAGYAHVFIDDVDFHDTPASVAIYLVDASKGGKLRVDLTNYVAGIGNVVGGEPHLVQFRGSIHDFDVEGRPFEPWTKLRRMSNVVVAVIVREGELDFRQIVISAEDRPEP